MKKCFGSRRWGNLGAAGGIVAVVWVVGFLFSPWVAAQSEVGEIAYVLPNDENGDEIRLIRADGSEDRLIWQVGKPDVEQVSSIGTLAWRADGNEIAFDSDHEGYCSIWESDLYAIRTDSSGYRRITLAPTCAELENFPKGTVHVPIRNFNLETTVFFPYVQGAASVQMITLGPGQGATVTFEEVADFGEGQLQWGVVASGAGRWFDAAAAVDVVPGGEVSLPLITVSGVAFPDFGASGPAWRSDGSELVYSFGYGTLYRIASDAGMLEIGEMVLPEGTEGPLFRHSPKWGPTAERADQILYGGGGGFDENAGIYLMTAGGDDAGEQIVAFETYDLVLGLDWLPDGSGFVYAVTEEFLQRGNLFVYTFATGESRRLTEFADAYGGILSVSPDGEQIVFERSVSESDLMMELADHEVWVVNRDGTGLRRLVEEGRAPAWRPQGADVVVGRDVRLTLPAVDPGPLFCGVVRGMRRVLMGDGVGGGDC